MLGSRNPLAKVNKLATCNGVFTFFTARQIVTVLQKHLSDSICAILLMSMIMCVVLNGDGSSPLFTMLTVGGGVIFTTWLERWISQWSQHSDWMVVYLIVFIVIEATNKSIKRHFTAPVAKEKGAILEVKGIAHHHALLGLPSVDDSSGAH